MRSIAAVALLVSLLGDGCVCVGRSGADAEQGGDRAGHGTSGPGSPNGGAGSGSSSSKCVGGVPTQKEPTVHEVGAGSLEDRLFGRTPAKVDVPKDGVTPCP